MKPRFADIASWLAWQETLHPNVIDLGLHRIQKVADSLLGTSTTRPFTITVAGTNGKGSCVTTLGHTLKACGKHVGCFTSPHLLRYNERIRIDGKEVSDAMLCDAFAVIDEIRGETSLTYFEFNALAALWIFRQAQVDVQVLEVGLGGRLDAVNIIDADIAVITNIALDHTDWLGSTREQIGTEKAGILRPHGKLVYGETDMPASILARVTELGCECRQLGADFSFTVSQQGWDWQGVDATGSSLTFTSLPPSLPLPSVACALQVLAWMGTWMGTWDPAILGSTLPGLSLQGRFEHRDYRNKQLVLDVAHNPAAAVFLSEKLRSMDTGPVDILFAVMADKDIGAIVSALKPAIAHWYLIALADNPRAATLEQLAGALDEQGIVSTDYTCCPDIAAGLQMALHSQDDRVLLVAGSFFTVAAVKAELADD